MRKNSVMNVLLLNCTLNYQLSDLSKCPPDLGQAIEARNINILSSFNLNPISVARMVLDSSLKLSGIFINNDKKRGKSLRNLPKIIRPHIPDPLEFMLIKK